MKCVITVKSGTKTLTRIEGRPGVFDEQPIGEVTEDVLTLESKLEKLTGHRYHISLIGDAEKE